jgi:transcriptional regulator with XRE-family HTH domain
MDGRRVPRTLRAIRRRKRLTQRAVGARIGLSQQEISRLELRDLSESQVGTVDRWARALGADLMIELRVSGERPLTDARHARLQNCVLAELRASGWVAAAEVSFSVFGERGRIDILAFHQTLRLLLVVEVKTRVEDVQDLLGRSDVKVRLAPELAAARGWNVDRIVPVLIVEDGRTARRRVEAHAALFARFDLRGRTSQAWLRHPAGRVPRGLLIFRRSQ